jgi:MFS family permease
MSIVSETAELPYIADDALYRKVGLRFIPLLFVCYILNYMDRTNIGFAHLQMQGDLKLTDIAYGIGAGMFFVSYSVFALPASFLFAKWGARSVIVACLIGWGITSAGTMFVRTPVEFYAIRFFLGVVEAGFFPAIIYYFGQWYPAQRRAGVIGIFTAATVVAGIVSGVLSGTIMTYLNGTFGWRGWQWMFLLEGLPAALIGIGVFFYLDEGPAVAKWISTEQKRALLRAIAEDPAASSGSNTFTHALLDWRVYLIGTVYFLSVGVAFILAFWQPSMIKSFGVSNVMLIGLYSTLPLIAAVVAKVYVGHSSDKHREIRWHFIVPALVGAGGFLLAGLFPHNLILGLACLTLATAGTHGCMVIIWAAPGLYLSGAAVASGVAIISTMGTLSGAVGPAMLGAMKTKSGGFTTGNYALAGILILAALLMFVFVNERTLRPTSYLRNKDSF